MPIGRAACSILALLLAAGSVAGQQASSFGRYPLMPLYSGAVTASQYLTRRDGVRLAISITRPSQSGQGPSFGKRRGYNDCSEAYGSQLHNRSNRRKSKCLNGFAC